MVISSGVPIATRLASIAFLKGVIIELFLAGTLFGDWAIWLSREVATCPEPDFLRALIWSKIELMAVFGDFAGVFCFERSGVVTVFFGVFFLSTNDAWFLSQTSSADSGMDCSTFELSWRTYPFRSEKLVVKASSSDSSLGTCFKAKFSLTDVLSWAA